MKGNYILSNERLTRDQRTTLKDNGFYVYSLRDNGKTFAIERFVVVNHVADMITDVPIPELEDDKHNKACINNFHKYVDKNFNGTEKDHEEFVKKIRSLICNLE